MQPDTNEEPQEIVNDANTVLPQQTETVLPQQTELYGQAQTVMIDPSTGLPVNVMFIQQDSAAPKVVGIFVIIWGTIMSILTLIGILGVSLLTNPDSDIYISEVADDPTILYLIYILSLLGFIANIVGGSFIVQKKTMGIQITWLSIIFLLVLDILLEITYPELASAQSGSLSTGINIAFTSVCSGICGLIVAIPLMISGSGMDDSSLVG